MESQRSSYAMLVAALLTSACSTSFYKRHCGSTTPASHACRTLEERCKEGDLGACRAFTTQVYLRPGLDGDDLTGDPEANVRLAEIQVANCGKNKAFASDLTDTALDMGRLGGANAIGYLERACECGWPAACIEAGKAYRRGALAVSKNGPRVQRDPAKAFTEFTAACEIGRQCFDPRTIDGDDDEVQQPCSSGHEACELAADMIDADEVNASTIGSASAGVLRKHAARLRDEHEQAIALAERMRQEAAARRAAVRTWRPPTAPPPYQPTVGLTPLGTIHPGSYNPYTGQIQHSYSNQMVAPPPPPPPIHYPR